MKLYGFKIYLYILFLKICYASVTKGLSRKHVITLRSVAKTELNFTEEKIKRFKLWEKGVVPYIIDEFSFDNVISDNIHNYLDNLNSIFGLLFKRLSKPPEDESLRWVLFLNRRGMLACEDYATDSFSNEGVQKVVLGYDCINDMANMGSILLAILGVPPQHNAPNRDSYIRINHDNIMPEKQNQFQRLKEDDWVFGDEYDFHSAGHYDFFKHTANGFATITSLKPYNNPRDIDKISGLSDHDVRKIKMLYSSMKNARLKIKSSQCNQIVKIKKKDLNMLGQSDKKKLSRPVKLNKAFDDLVAQEMHKLEEKLTENKDKIIDISKLPDFNTDED